MTVPIDRLLAKSCRAGVTPVASATLAGHIADVLESVEAILDATGPEQLKALGLSPASHEAPFRSAVRLAAAIHDLGKANDHFQAAVRGEHSHVQGLRHEWVGYLLLTLSDLREWLSSHLEMPELFFLALWAMTGHHPAYGRLAPREPPSGALPQIEVLCEHPDFLAALTVIEERLGLPQAPRIPAQTYSLRRLDPGNAYRQLQRALRDDTRRFERFTPSQRRLLAACKACLIAADVAGSALPRELPASHDRQRWIGEVLSVQPDPQDLRSLVEERLQGQTLWGFQRALADTEASSPPPRVTLVLAGCGSGKTAAAYLWAASSAPRRRLFFCYPTTGTATEGFRGYLFDPELARSRHGARLFHSRAAVDYTMVLGTPEDDDDGLRIESLRNWSVPLACCTADTVLGLLHNHRRSLFAWPAMAQAAFVFDEIHAYDDRMFATLLRLIDVMEGAPILLMTAEREQGNRCRFGNS